jgi:heat shock protein HslJ
MKNVKVVGVVLIAIAVATAACARASTSLPPTPTAEPPGAPTSTPTEQAPAPTAEPTKEPAGGSETGATQEPTEQPTEQPTEAPGSNDLAGTSWTLTEINGSAPVAGTHFSLTFADTDLSGTACNGFGAPYTASGGNLTVGEIIHTMMACTGPEGIMGQETAYLGALSAAIHYTLAGNQLTLGSEADPSTLVFTAGMPETGSEPEGWPVYRNETFGFEIGYPEGGANPPTGNDTSMRIDLPFTAGTNLQEKYLQIDASSGATECASPLTAGYAPGALTPESVTIGGLDWTKVSGSDAGAGNYYDFTAYTTTQGDTCVSLSFMLHSTAAQNYTPPLQEFDRDAESAIFEQIVATFHWLP